MSHLTPFFRVLAFTRCTIVIFVSGNLFESTVVICDRDLPFYNEILSHLKRIVKPFLRQSVRSGH